MSHYLLTMKPIEHFFFGVEKVGNLGNRKPYYLETTEFPQQTSILGLLRYVILLKEGKLGTNLGADKKVNELIGSDSFPGNSKTGYGVIKELSPVFIVENNNNTAYFTRPLDWQYRFVKKDLGCKVSYGVKIEILDFIPFLDNYKAKEGIHQYLISSRGHSIPLWYDKKTKEGVLRKQAKSGNQKNPERFLNEEEKKDDKMTAEAKNEAYYKQEFLYMESKFAYACVVEIDDNRLSKETALKDFKTVVPFGGERSSFAISFKELDTVSVNQYHFDLQPQNNYLKIELLSDAFVEQDILSMTSLAVCDTIGFRNLSTKTTTKNYSRISKDTNHESADLSDQLQLLKRGSVFFFDSMAKMEEAEELLQKGKEHFTTIGYNKYNKYKLETINNHGTI